MQGAGGAVKLDLGEPRPSDAKFFVYSPDVSPDYDLEADDDGAFPRRHGTWQVATAHIVTAIVGAGVLSLPWAIAQVGWIFGPVIMALFGLVTWTCANFLCDVYRSGDEFSGKRNRTYSDVVKANLGRKHQVAAAFSQYLALFVVGTGYIVTGSISIVAAKRSICFHRHANVAHSEAPCSFDNLPWILMFGAIMIVLSQLRNFGELWWLSYAASATSFGYCGIGLGLSIAKITEGGNFGSVLGATGPLPPPKTAWNILVAIGSIAFAFSFSLVLIEIADTLKQPPSEKQSMRKANALGIGTAAFFYMTVGCLGYAAFGNNPPGNLMTGFGFFDPYWLVTVGNILIWLHLLASYQILMQPLMQAIEWKIVDIFPTWSPLEFNAVFTLPVVGRTEIKPLRLVCRTILVCISTLLAALLPFYNSLVGLIGSICFWPLTVYFPTEIFLKVNSVRRYTSSWWWIRAMSSVTLLASLGAAIGSIASLIIAVRGVSVFASVSDSLANP